MRLIDADALKKSLQDSYNDLKRIYDGLHYDEEKRICAGQLTTFMEAILRVKEMPTIEAEPVKCGRWIKYYNSFFGQHQCFCSECERDEYWQKYYCYGIENYCPNCGAKMDGGAEA